MKTQVCPCPCPVNSVISPSEITLPIGSFVRSPGGSFQYEILSEPIERKYRDWKGGFEAKGFKFVQNTILTLAEYLAENESEVSQWEDFLVRFFAQFRQQESLKVPSLTRFFWIFWSAYCTKHPKIYFSLSHSLCPYHEMPHKDESSWLHDGKKWVEQEHAIKSYWVRCWWKNEDGTWRNGEPQIKTIRWQLPAEERLAS